MLGSGVPGWFAGRVMGFKGDSSRKDFVSGSTDSVMLVFVASRSPGSSRRVGLLGAEVSRPLVP